ncbi:MAG: transposase [bacterium]
MQLAIKVKLIPSKEQQNVLFETIEVFNEACNFVSQIAFENKTASVVKIHRICYYDIRKRFNLSSQMAVRVVGKVADAYKVARNRKLKLDNPHKFFNYGAVIYDQRILTWKGLEKVSILTLQGRQVIPIVLGGYQEAKLQFPRRGQVDLLYKNGKFYLVAIVDAPEPPEKVSKEFLGIDMGIAQLAVDSKGEFYSGKEVDNKRVKIDKLKSGLQKNGSKSAKRHLKKLSGKEKRFRKDVNHYISKKIIEKCKRHSLSLAIEDLAGIRQRATVRKAQRRQHSSWAFNQLRGFLEYKAKLAGVIIRLIDPHYTSQRCSNCGYIAKHNRKNQSNFVCRSCGFSANADHNGAMNIAQLATANLPIVAPQGSYKPLSL